MKRYSLTDLACFAVVIVSVLYIAGMIAAVHT